MSRFLVYTAGPITGETYEGATGWREYVSNTSSPYIQTMSPMRGKEFLKNVKQISDYYDEMSLASVKGINTRDFFDVQRADAIFVNFLGSRKVSIGTVMEIAWARAFNKPIVCCMEPDNIHQHSMLNYACGYITNNLDSGIKLLEALLLPDLLLQQQVIRNSEL